MSPSDPNPLTSIKGNQSRNGGTKNSHRRPAHDAQDIFAKPYRALVDILHISERDAHYRLAAKRKYTAVEISRLLQSEHGINFLVVLMDRARPAWWRAVLKMGALGSIELRRCNEIKLMQRVFNADTAANAKFSHSFRAQDEDFFGAVLAGFDEMSALGLPDSAVASKAKR